MWNLTTSSRNIFVENQKDTRVEGDWLLKIYILFCGDSSWTVALRQIKFGKVKDHGHSYKLDYYFVWRSF
jgi:hypothetical protein